MKKFILPTIVTLAALILAACSSSVTQTSTPTEIHTAVPNVETTENVIQVDATSGETNTDPAA